MKGKILILMVCLLALATPGFAQCTINTGNTTDGFTPASLNCIQQSTAYGQALQLHVPATYQTLTIDSMKITGITGAPFGIAYALNPSARAIPGGGNGCIWFSGTTTDPVGSYPLTFNVNAWLAGSPTPQSLTLNQVGFNYSLQVCTGATVCDTLRNIVGGNVGIYTYPGDSGYISGNNWFGDLAKAEKFSGTGTSGKQLKGAYLFFGHTRYTTATNNVTIRAWVADGQGKPGTTIASQNVQIGNISTTGLTWVTFSTPPTLNGSDFFVGVVLPTNGDTVVLYTSQIGPTTGNGWEQWDNGNWYSYQQALGLGTNQMGNIIGAVLCGTGGNAPTAAFSGTPTTGCGSVTASFTDNSTGGPILSWAWTFQGGNPASSNVQNPTGVVFTGTGGHTVSLTVTNASGSNTSTQPNYVTVNAVPTPTIQVTNATSQSSANGSLTVSATGTCTYAWSGGGTAATKGSLLPGNYTVTVTCGGCSATASATVGVGVGVEEIKGDMAVQVYPNPATSVIQLAFTKNYHADGFIYSVDGKLCKQFGVMNMNETVDVSDLTPGIYTIRISDRNTNETGYVKVIKY